MVSFNIFLPIPKMNNIITFMIFHLKCPTNQGGFSFTIVFIIGFSNNKIHPIRAPSYSLNKQNTTIPFQIPLWLLDHLCAERQHTTYMKNQQSTQTQNVLVHNSAIGILLCPAHCVLVVLLGVEDSTGRTEPFTSLWM